jgi:hypothetical protein
MFVQVLCHFPLLSYGGFVRTDSPLSSLTTCLSVGSGRQLKCVVEGPLLPIKKI